MQEFTAGDRYPITPSSEYFAVHIVDESFNVVGFASNFQARDIRQFPHTPLRYGAITLDDECPPIVDEIILTSYDMNTKVPFFLVDFSDLGWQIGVGFNMPREPRFRRQRFLSDDTHNRVNRVLCDYPTALILAIRGIDIRLDTMREIKEVCDHVQAGRLTARSARRQITYWAELAGVEGFISGHSLRVGSAVSLAQAGASVVDMQVAGRWKSSTMPAHYAKAELAERGAIARFKEKRGKR
jgi:hypothetical protein